MHIRERKKQKASFSFRQWLCIFNQIECKNYRASCICPRVLPNHFPCTFLILKSDIKHLGEVLAKTMWGCTLYTTTSVWNESLIKWYLATSIQYNTEIYFPFHQGSKGKATGMPQKFPYQYLNTGGIESTCKFFHLTFPPFGHWNC